MLYRYLFYRSYDLVRLTGNYDLIWGASHFIALNTTIMMLELLANFTRFLDSVLLFGIVGAFVLIGLHTLNFFLFLKEGKGKKVLLQFEKESKTHKIMGRSVMILWVVLIVYFAF